MPGPFFDWVMAIHGERRRHHRLQRQLGVPPAVMDHFDAGNGCLEDIAAWPSSVCARIRDTPCLSFWHALAAVERSVMLGQALSFLKLVRLFLAL